MKFSRRHLALAGLIALAACASADASPNTPAPMKGPMTTVDVTVFDVALPQHHARQVDFGKALKQPPQGASVQEIARQLSAFGHVELEYEPQITARPGYPARTTVGSQVRQKDGTMTIDGIRYIGTFNPRADGRIAIDSKLVELPSRRIHRMTQVSQVDQPALSAFWKPKQDDQGRWHLQVLAVTPIDSFDAASQ